MDGRAVGTVVAAVGVAVAVVAHPPYPIPYVFESVSMALFLPLAATTLTVAGGTIVALAAETTPARAGLSIAVDFAPLWAVAVVGVYLVGVPGFGLRSPLILFSLSLGVAAGLLVAVINRVGQ